MNKSQLIESISNKAKISKKDAENYLNKVLFSITEFLQNGHDVKILGFGNFIVKKRESRIGRNPRTGEQMKISASKSVSFKVGKDLKEAVKKC